MPTTLSKTISDVRLEDAAAVARIMDRIAAGWRSGDADAVCAVFSPHADLVMPGVMVAGRQAIRAWLADAFQGHWNGMHVLIHTQELRYLRDDIMVLTSVGGPYVPGEAEVSELFAVHGMWVFAKTEDGWLADGYCNTPLLDSIPLPGAPTAAGF